MKSFFIGVLSSLVVSIGILVVTIVVSQPVIMYEISERGSDIKLRALNIGLFPASRVNFELSTRSKLADKVYFEKMYWIPELPVESFYKISSFDTRDIITFDDRSELDEFSSGEEIRVLLTTNKPLKANMIEAHSFNSFGLIEGKVFYVEDIESTQLSIFGALIIIVVVSIAWFILGFQLAKPKKNPYN